MTEKIKDNNIKKEEINEINSPKQKMKINIVDLAIWLTIAIIVIGFVGVVYYNYKIYPQKQLEKKLGYDPDDHIASGNNDDLKAGKNEELKFEYNYTITQDMFDELVSSYNSEYNTVDRGCKEGDSVDFNYTAKINGKKDKNISEKEVGIIIGEELDDVYIKFADAMLGKKEGEKVDVVITAEEATFLSENGTEYTEEVNVTLKILSVMEETTYEITDDWVKENLLDDYGVVNVDEFYEMIEDEIRMETEVELWNMAVEDSQMSSYPEELYEKVVIEFTQNANANAEMFGMTREEYLYTVEGYTEETLEEEYLREVKSELLMWKFVKELGLEASEEEIQAEYERFYYELGYDSVEAMKEDYVDDDMKESVLLEEVHTYIYEHSNIKKEYKIP